MKVSFIGLLFLLASTLGFGKQSLPHDPCSLGNVQEFSLHRMKSMLRKTEPISVSCCGHGLHINGLVIVSVTVDTGGEVACVRVVSGHPLLYGTVIDSVRHWKFWTYSDSGAKRNFSGKLALSFRATDQEVRYKVVVAP
jgi:hypothetical protein